MFGFFYFFWMTWLHQLLFALNCSKRIPPANPLIPYAHMCCRMPPDCSPHVALRAGLHHMFPPTMQAPPFFMQPSFNRCFWSCLVDSPTSASPSCFPIIRNPDDLSKAAIEVPQNEEIWSDFLNREQSSFLLVGESTARNSSQTKWKKVGHGVIR